MDDLIGEFITETTESLALLDSELVNLERNPNDQGILGNIFRLVHTIKGTCGFLGLPRLESVAHAGENVLGKIRDGEIIVTQEAISIVLEALDCIKGLIEHLASQGAEPAGDDRDLIARLNAFAESRGASAGAAPASAPAPAPAVSAPPPEDMMAPDEREVSGGGGGDNVTLDELERIFRETPSAMGDGIDYTRAPQAAAPAVATPPATPRPAMESAKDKAIKQGLEADAKDKDAGGLAGQSIRVNLEVLENLMQMVGELVLTRNQLLQIVRHRDDRELKAPLQQLSQITSELQESVMKTRMQPIGNAWSKFPRLIRDLSHELSKKIELRMLGESTELDRQLLEMIKDPLTHMVRNSCDHGLEVPADRLAAGKSETGTVQLSAYHEGGHIIIEIADDGRGLNVERIRQKIVEKGLAEEHELAQMGDEQVMQYIFKPGFSTAEKVTSVSGRGVGMDVVRTNIEKIGGTVSLSSTLGKGSVFQIKIPLTLAIVSVLLIEASGQKFAIPQLNVIELVRAGAESEYKIEHISDSAVLRLRDRLLPLMRLRDILKLPAAAEAEPDCYIAVLRIGATDVGLIVDTIYDTEEIVVKPVSKVIGDLDIYSGNTILGDGSVIMILDPNGIAKSYGERDTGKRGSDDAAADAASQERLASFLVFTAGGGAPKGVPLELVSRLEVIDSALIERSGNNQVVQYRGDLMRLKALPGSEIPTSGEFDVVVFTYDGRTVGLAVEEIVDIILAPLTIKMTAKEEQFLGSSVIAGKTTDIVDVGYLLNDLVGDLERAGAPRAAAEGARVLVVEDSVFFRRLVMPFLSNLGYHVTEAANAPEALSILQSSPRFDIIVTDIEMPEMDGFEFASVVAADSRYAGIPVIAYTSTVNEHFRQRGLKAHLRDMILKTDREALLVAIERQLHPEREAA